MDPVKEFEAQQILVENIFKNINNLISRNKQTNLQQQIDNPAFDAFKDKYATSYKIKNDPNDKTYNSYDLLHLIKNKSLPLDGEIRRTDSKKWIKVTNVLRFEPFKSMVPQILNPDNLNPVGGKTEKFTVVFPNSAKHYNISIKQIANVLSKHPTLTDMTKIQQDGSWLYLTAHPAYKEISKWMQYHKVKPSSPVKKKDKAPALVVPRYTTYFTNHPDTKLRKKGYNLSPEEIAKKLVKNPGLRNFIKILDKTGKIQPLTAFPELNNEVINWVDHYTGRTP